MSILPCVTVYHDDGRAGVIHCVVWTYLELYIVLFGVQISLPSAEAQLQAVSQFYEQLEAEGVPTR